METDRLILKLYNANEKPLFIKLFTDEDVMKHVDTGVITIEKADSLWQKLIEDFYPKGVHTIYAVFAKSDGRYIGHASLRPRPEKKKIGKSATSYEKKNGAKALRRKLPIV